MTLPKLHRELAIWFGTHADRNRVPLTQMQRTFSVSQFALLIQMFGLIATIGDAIHV